MKLTHVSKKTRYLDYLSCVFGSNIVLLYLYNIDILMIDIPLPSKGGFGS